MSFLALVASAGRRRTIRAVQVAIVVASLTGAGEVLAGVTLGASFGYTHLSYPDSPGLTNNVVGIPSNEEWGQPGIRVGYRAPGGGWDLNADVGLVHESSTIGITETRVELLPQFQANLRRGGGVSPFVNVGVGIEHFRVDDLFAGSVAATRPVFGGGIGVRKPVSDGHGLVRVELRYDRLPKRVKVLDPFTTITFLATNMLSVKLGFDLLVRR